MMQKIQCPICGKTAFYAAYADIEIKCEHCRRFIKAVIKPDGTKELSVVQPRSGKTA